MNMQIFSHSRRSQVRYSGRRFKVIQIPPYAASLSFISEIYRKHKRLKVRTRRNEAGWRVWQIGSLKGSKEIRAKSLCPIERPGRGIKSIFFANKYSASTYGCRAVFPPHKLAEAVRWDEPDSHPLLRHAGFPFSIKIWKMPIPHSRYKEKMSIVRFLDDPKLWGLTDIRLTENIRVRVCRNTEYPLLYNGLPSRLVTSYAMMDPGLMMDGRTWYLGGHGLRFELNKGWERWALLGLALVWRWFGPLIVKGTVAGSERYLVPLRKDYPKLVKTHDFKVYCVMRGVYAWLWYWTYLLQGGWLLNLDSQSMNPGYVWGWEADAEKYWEWDSSSNTMATLKSWGEFVTDVMREKQKEMYR